jgi:hypothetical protein
MIFDAVVCGNYSLSTTCQTVDFRNKPNRGGTRNRRPYITVRYELADSVNLALSLSHPVTTITKYEPTADGTKKLYCNIPRLSVCIHPR